MKFCEVCGKLFACQPDFWPYRRGEDYLCTENCLIVYDTSKFRERTGWIEDYYRRKKQMKKVTLEQKKKAVEIAIGGGNPLQYLKQCGASAPAQMWYAIKQNLKKVDPARYEMLLKRVSEKNEAPKVNLTIDFEELTETDKDIPKVVTCCAPSTRKGVEVPDELPNEDPDRLPENSLAKSAEILENAEKSVKSERKPLNYEGYEVAAIRSKSMGEFYYDRKYNSIDWRTVEGEEISMSPGGWRQLMQELPEIMGILGI